MKPHRLYSRAIKAARDALRYLAPDQLPSSLAPVAGHSGSLTPPLNLLLLKAIDEYDWLREKALEQWPDANPKAEGADMASALLLIRPPGWTQLIAAEAARIADEESATAGLDVSKEAERLSEEVVTLKKRLKAERRERDAAETAAEQLKKQAPSGVPVERLREAEAALEAKERALEAAADALASAEDVLAIERQAAAKLAEELRDMKRQKAEAEAMLTEVPDAWDASDPAELARRMDDMARMARAPARRSRPRVSSTGESTRLPVGVSPDSPEAVDSLLHQERRLVMIVDGYNSGLKLAPDPAGARQRLELILRALDSSAGGKWRIIVVYDSSVGHGESGGRSGGVEIRFAPSDATADDVIVAATRQNDDVVVVSSDRELRERVEAEGALALWSDAITGWKMRR